VNCGHPPALLIRSNGDAEELGATGTVVGLFANPESSIGQTRLEPGDTLALYTDGVSECADASGAEFGTERLLASLRRTKDLGAAALLDEILSELLQFGGQQQQDDITLVLARRLPA